MRRLILIILLFNCVSCSTEQIVAGALEAAWDGTRTAVNARQMYKEAMFFNEHWELLKAYKWDDQDYPSVEANIESDLENIALSLRTELRDFVAENPVFQEALFRDDWPQARVSIELDGEKSAYVKQVGKSPEIVIPITMLVDTLEKFGEQMRSGEREFRSEHSGMTESDLQNAVTEQVKIPRALEYKDSIVFLLAHELIHAYFDPPLRPKDLTRDIEKRADALGLLVTSRQSFIVEKKQELGGIDNLYLIVKSNSAHSMFSPVLYARFGPELLFEVNHKEFAEARPDIYSPVDQRISQAKDYMRNAVATGIHTDTAVWFDYVINSVSSR